MNIAAALSAGYTIAQAINFLTGNFPNIGKKIKQAQKLGYDVEKIVKSFSSMNPQELEQLENSKQLESNNPWINSINTQRENSAAVKGKEYLIKGAKLAAIPLAAYGLQRYLNKAVQPSQILPALPQNPQLPAPATNPQIPQNPPSPTPINPQPSPPPPSPQSPISPGSGIGQQVQQQAQAPVISAKQPTSESEIAEAAQMMPQEQSQQQVPIFEQLLGGIDPSTLEKPKQDQLKFLSMISDQLQSKGKNINDPEFKNLSRKIKSVIAGTPGMMVEEMGRFPKENSNVNPLYNEKANEITSIVEPSKIQKPFEIKKGESVVTESGNLAEIKGVSGHNFLIEEDGKVRQVPMDSLRSEPEAIKKAKIVFDPAKIPEEERSAALAISLPMPDRSAIINMFHDGSFYVYKRKDGKPIDDTIIKRIVEGQDIPISTGETFMGAWNQNNGDSRGSASFKELTAMAQDATKEDDPSKPLIFEKITNGYTHGYLKEFQRLLKEANRIFSVKPKNKKK